MKIQHFFKREPNWKETKPYCIEGKHGDVSHFIMGEGEEISDLQWHCSLYYEYSTEKYGISLIADDMKGGRVRDCTIDVDIYVTGKGKTLKSEYRNETIGCGSLGRRKDFTESEMGSVLEDCFLTRGGNLISAIIVDINVIKKNSSDMEMRLRLRKLSE